jgi:flagellar hook-associated protein 3 FlgL
MAIVPLQLARVSNSLRSAVSQRNITRTQQALLEVQNQLASGRRLNRPSDNPADSAIAQQLRKVLEQRIAYADNLRAASSHLSQVDTTLESLSDLLRQAQTIASANVGSIVSADERSAAAAIVTNLYNQALSLANAQYQGVYLFGGDRGAQQPFTPDLGGVRFTGSESVLLNRFDESTVLPFMVNGNEVFGALSTRVRGSADLTPAITDQTRLSDLRGALGQGIRLGSIRLSDGTTTRIVDLSHADVVGDVIDAINAAGIGGISAAIALDGRGLHVSGPAGATISIADMGGTTAADLGIRTAGALAPGMPVEGAPLGATLTAFTRLDDLRGGAGIDRDSGLILRNGERTVTIDLSAAQTVEDLLNAFNSAGVGVFARINADGTGIDVLNSVQGLTMSIAENGGTTATDLGIRSFSPQTPLAELNFGRGLRTVEGADLLITRRDGTSFEVDLSGARSIQDVLDLINAADGGGGVSASFAVRGNGIVLSDSTGGTGTLRVSRLNYSMALEDLGLDVDADGNTLQARDVNGVHDASLFGNLGRLRDALMRNDQNGITEAAERLRADLDRVVRIRGQVGAQVQELESRQQRLEDQNLATQSMLSLLEDTDYNQAIMRFQSLQTALQANLQTTGTMLNLSLLDFLG